MIMDLNRVTLIGRIASDLDVKETKDWKNVFNFSLVTNKVYKNKDWEKVQEAEFHKVVMFSAPDFMKDALSKWTRVWAEWSLKTDKYDKDWVTMYSTKVIANNVGILESKNKDEGTDEGTGGDTDEDLPF